MLLCNDFSLLSKLQANGEYRSPDKGLKTSVFPTAKKWKVGKVHGLGTKFSLKSSLPICIQYENTGVRNPHGIAGGKIRKNSNLRTKGFQK